MSERHELENVRRDKLEQLKSNGIDPFPRTVERTHTNEDAIAFYESDPEAIFDAAVVGRLRSIRDMGKSLFAHIEDESGKLQLYFKADDLGQERFDLFKSIFDLGDFIQAKGTVFRTRTGEVTVRVEDYVMLAKALSPLPASKEEIVDGEMVVHSAFDNPEARYRERYADLAVNPEVREIFRIRARIIDALRQFLNERDFIEVETPILQPIYGGAAARPFVTHHNQLHQDLYLRISFELYLKRLLVGNLERVYEIGRDFRNEGVDRTHNPEFTMLEFYMAYADYQAVMELTEQMVASAAEKAVGSTKITFQGNEIDLSPPWVRKDLRGTLLEFSGIDIQTFQDADSLRDVMRSKGLNPSPESTRGKLVESLLEHYLEPVLIQPTILYDYPRDVSPLSKSTPEDPTIVERFEVFIGGMELCNAFTELNDPLDQQARFQEMGRDYSEGSEDRHPMDEDYLRSMRYGMPPNGGFGMGIDRLTMLLTDRPSIREVILFPHLRAKDGSGG